jgi:chemotaxis protein methyltransferase CheR
MNELEEREFKHLRDLICRKTGIFFDDNKKHYLVRRLEYRMKALGYERLLDYYRFLKYDTSGKEWDSLFNIVTTNETYFFRNIPQLTTFKEEVLPLVITQKRKNHDYDLKIWSAGCSTGEEPYTLAMFLLEVIPDIRNWKIQILGTDINTQVLQRAREGIYDYRSVRELPPRYTLQYFQLTDKKYILKDKIKEMVTFTILNLVSSEQMKSLRNFDFIFCRNVLIYFNQDWCKKVVNSFYDSLNKGGYLFLGHAESLYRITAIFKLAKFKNSLVYMKE